MLHTSLFQSRVLHKSFRFSVEYDRMTLTKKKNKLDYILLLSEMQSICMSQYKNNPEVKVAYQLNFVY